MFKNIKVSTIYGQVLYINIDNISQIEQNSYFTRIELNIILNNNTKVVVDVKHNDEILKLLQDNVVLEYKQELKQD